MRIISQNEKTNLSYDNVTISTGTKLEKNSFVYTVNARDSLLGKPITLGKYSTAEKARRVFEQIIIYGNSDAKDFRMPKENEL